MIKKLFVFTFIFFWLFTSSTFAHTGLKSSSPADGEVVRREIQKITLTFDTKVEQNSKFTLNDSNGNLITIGDMELNENTIVGNLLEPLKNGDYQLIWKIIGADGHPIEGEFSFSVDLLYSEAPTVENSEVKEEIPIQSKEKKLDLADEIENVPIQKKLINTLLPFIIGGLFVIVIGSFIWLIRRKN